MSVTLKTALGVAMVAGPLLAQAQTTYNYNGTVQSDGSVQTYIVSQSGIYDVDVLGAAGGTANASSGPSAGGSGAEVDGDLYLTAGTVLQIVVGGQGGMGTTYMAKSTSSTSYYAAGGGGGSFVYITGAVNPLIVAGGGGGAGYGQTGADAQTTDLSGNIVSNGGNGGGSIPGAGLGGTGGAGGAGGSNLSGAYGDNGGGGAGWLSAGTAGTPKSSGGGGSGIAGAWAGGAGGTSCIATDYSCSGSSVGGFGGGGGGGYNGGGGGGGYSGGGGATGASKSNYFGGGGGSFYDATQVTLNANNVNNLSADSVGNGEVIITEISSVPLPASAWLLLSGLGGFAVVARRRRAA